MKFLKYFFFLILIVIISGAVYFGAQDGKFNIVATRTLNVPNQVAFQLVNNLETWKQWGPWMEMDPNIKIELGDSLIGSGAHYSWDSDHPDIGSGSILTLNSLENEAIAQEITFPHMFGAGTHQMNWNFSPEQNGMQTTISWGIQGELSILEKAAAFFSRDSKSPTQALYETGLVSLEQHALSLMEKYSVQFDGIVEYGGGYFMYVTSASDRAGLSAKMGPMLGEISGYMQSNKIASNGMPFTIYNQVDATTGNMIFSSCIPVKERVITAAGSSVLCGYMAPLTAIKTTLTGHYDNLEAAYNKGLAYITEKGLIQDPANPLFEVYTSDPGEDPNPANWITEVYIPILTPQETIN